MFNGKSSPQWTQSITAHLLQKVTFSVDKKIVGGMKVSDNQNLVAMNQKEIDVENLAAMSQEDIEHQKLWNELRASKPTTSTQTLGGFIAPLAIDPATVNIWMWIISTSHQSKKMHSIKEQTKMSCYDDDCLLSTYWGDDMLDYAEESLKIHKIRVMSQNLEYFELEVHTICDDSVVMEKLSKYNNGHFRTTALMKIVDDLDRDRENFTLRPIKNLFAIEQL